LLLALFLFFVVFKKIINFFLTIEMGKKYSMQLISVSENFIEFSHLLIKKHTK